MLTAAVGVWSSCKDRDEDPNESVSVLFNVTGSPGVQLKAVVTQIGTVQGTVYNFTPPGNTWSSQPQIIDTSVGAVHLSMTGQGASADSRAVLSIWINGEKKTSDTVKGINLMGKSVVSFLK
ncbi:MAG: hypothetical protein ABS44_03730 [Chryseobacterium sp. SCN 40-13]|nr:MAG: hypothetical protein ABS44_03730 [Chryseobacterium sp. SCN 40-13]